MQQKVSDLCQRDVSDSGMKGRIQVKLDKSVRRKRTEPRWREKFYFRGLGGGVRNQNKGVLIEGRIIGLVDEDAGHTSERKAPPLQCQWSYSTKNHFGGEGAEGRGESCQRKAANQTIS